ncbi:PapD-like protein [Paraphysoderma sedebokerense]|nr:PapD-like protein [Paraphysoderma sedebokerense]
MSIVLEPAQQLSFKRPFTQVVTTALHLKNPSDDTLSFKVKTTSPKQYCVRPNSGIIGPGENVDVQILLQPMKEDPPADFKCKDKFLVQSMKVSGSDLEMGLPELWAMAEKERKSMIAETKLRVVFLSENGGEDAVGTGNNSPAVTPVQPPNRVPSPYHSSKADEGNSPARSLTPSQATGSQQSQSQVLNRQELIEAKEKVARLERLVESYKSEIEKLRDEANQLRNRKPTSAAGASPASPSTATKTAIKHASPAPSDFSPQMLLLLVLSFLAGVLFF